MRERGSGGAGSLVGYWYLKSAYGNITNIPTQKQLASGVQELSFSGTSDVVINVHPSPFQDPGFVVPVPSVAGRGRQ